MTYRETVELSERHFDQDSNMISRQYRTGGMAREGEKERKDAGGMKLEGGASKWPQVKFWAVSLWRRSPEKLLLRNSCHVIWKSVSLAPTTPKGIVSSEATEQQHSYSFKAAIERPRQFFFFGANILRQPWPGSLPMAPQTRRCGSFDAQYTPQHSPQHLEHQYAHHACHNELENSQPRLRNISSSYELLQRSTSPHSP